MNKNTACKKVNIRYDIIRFSLASCSSSSSVCFDPFLLPLVLPAIDSTSKRKTIPSLVLLTHAQPLCAENRLFFIVDMPSYSSFASWKLNLYRTNQTDFYNYPAHLTKVFLVNQLWWHRGEPIKNSFSHRRWRKRIG